MENEILEYFGGDELAASVWKGKYAQEGEKAPDDMFRRMAKEFARVDVNYQKKELPFDIKNKLSDYGQKRENLTEESIFNLFYKFNSTVPQGRVMSGLGVEDKYRSLSNCLRLPSPKDSYSSIMYTDTMLVSAAKRGCGYGLGISHLRPKETNVKNAANTSTGAVSFMERYSNSTREVGQAGRRGACLIDIDVNHPDVLDFINIKRDLTKVTGANISIFLNDIFLNAVKNNESYVLKFPCDATLSLVKYDEWYPNWDDGNLHYIPKDDAYVKVIKAKEYWDIIVDSARTMADPGLFFRNRMMEYSPSNVYLQYKEDGTNACGEQPMTIYDTCRLILTNLYSFVKDMYTESATVDFDLLYKVCYETMRLGDNLVDLEIEYLDRILKKIKEDSEPMAQKQIEFDLWTNVKDMAKNGRRVGCGITALGDMLAALLLKYGEEESFEIVDKVMHTKMEAELDCSIDLAILRGAFDGFDADLEFPDGQGGNDFYTMLLNEFPVQVERMKKYGRRNINWSTIAPAGSVSILTQTTSGCEPLFSPYYFRRKKINPNEVNSQVDFVDQNGDSWTEYPVLHPKFKNWIISSSYSDLEGVEAGLSKDYLKHCYEKSPWYMSTANDINWYDRLKMQSILQKYTTSAISSTLNLPKNTTNETVSNIYFEAWKLGLKGVTIYVDGSRSGVLVTESAKNNSNFEYKDAVKRPKSIKGEAFISTIKGEQFNVIVGVIDNKPYEIFAFLDGKSKGDGKIVKHKRGDYRFEAEGVEEQLLSKVMSDEQSAITRLISTSLRHGTDIKHIVEQLSKSSGNISSFSSALSRILKKYIKDGEKANGTTCTECGGSNVVFEEGCKTCKDCGSSKCS